MKRIVYIVAGLVVGCLIGRLTVKPEVRTEVVTEYRPILTSITAPSSISQPVGSRIEKVKLWGNIVPNIDHFRDATNMDHQEDNFPNIDHSGNSTIMVDHIEEMREMVDSAEVELPIRDYTFSDDSTYTITARGVYVESLPRVEFYPRTTRTRTEQVVRTPRISHGIQMGGGLALTPKGLQPALFVGYGLNIRF